MGDLEAQTQESLTNVQALITTANSKGKGPFSLTERALWRAYVRRFEDIPEVKRLLCQALGRETPLMVLCAGLCREELLVEIEGMCVAG